MRTLEARRAAFEANTISFLNTEVDLAKTFIKMAKEARNRERRKKLRKDARKAYDTVLRFLGKITPSENERAEINAQLAHLKSKLQSLGETF